jgi:multidrug efflux pump subunit AcrB
VLALLILIISPLVILRTPVDIFPNVNIPVVAALWNYTGPERRGDGGAHRHPIERSLTTTVNDIDHMESQTVDGRSITKVFFHPKARISTWRWRR